jgi:hypothetical protein
LAGIEVPRGNGLMKFHWQNPLKGVRRHYEFFRNGILVGELKAGDLSHPLWVFDSWLHGRDPLVGQRRCQIGALSQNLYKIHLTRWESGGSCMERMESEWQNAGPPLTVKAAKRSAELQLANFLNTMAEDSRAFATALLRKKK